MYLFGKELKAQECDATGDAMKYKIRYPKISYVKRMVFIKMKIERIDSTLFSYPAFFSYLIFENGIFPMW